MNLKARLERIRILWGKAVFFARQGVWRESLPPAMTWRGTLMRFIRMAYLVVKGFRHDEIRLHAMSLTYSTLMALVPLLALSLSVLKGLGYDTRFLKSRTDLVEDMPQQFQDFVQDTFEVVDKTDFAQLGGIGGVILLFMVVQMLSRIESSFNNLWGITRARSWTLKITHYISIVVIVPILMVAAITVTAKIKMDGALLEQLGLLRVAPFLASWLAFGFLYQAMPNTRVRLLPAIISGLTGAVLWQLWFRLYITIQPGVTNYNALYGTLASIPIFLAWLFISWIIVLVGAKVAFAVQNGANYELESDGHRANLQTRALIGLAALVKLGECLEGKKNAFDARVFAAEHGIPNRLMDEILDVWVKAGWVAETAGEPDTHVLRKTPRQIEIQRVLVDLMAWGEDFKKLKIKPFPKPIHQTLDKLFDRMGPKKTLSDLMAALPEDRPSTAGIEVEGET